MAGFFDAIRQTIGNNVDQLGTALNLPGLGLSEAIAGNATTNTGRVNENLLGSSIGPNSGNVISNGLIQPQGQSVTFGTPANDANGQVNGISTGNPNGLSLSQLAQGASAASTGLTPAQIQALSNTASTGIQQSYQNTLDQLNQNQGAINQQFGDLTGQTNTMFDQQKGQLDSQLQSAQKDLQNTTTQVGTNRDRALTDLTTGLRQQMDSFVRLLGSYGAVDSSAAGMGQYAFSQLGSKERAAIYQQANDLLNQVDQRRETVNTTYNQNLSQLANWKQNQLFSLEQDWKQKNAQIQQAKLQADGDRLKQLNDLQLQIQQQAVTNAIQVDQKVAQVAAINQQWAQSQAQSLSDMKSQLAQSLSTLNQQNVATSYNPITNTAINGNLGFTAANLQGPQQSPASAVTAVLPQNRKDQTQQ